MCIFLWFLVTHLHNQLQFDSDFCLFSDGKWGHLKLTEKTLFFEFLRCDLKVNVPKYQNNCKKSLNQEKLVKFVFAQVLWEILDFYFLGPKIKKFNNNQKFLKHPDFSTLEYYK